MLLSPYSSPSPPLWLYLQVCFLFQFLHCCPKNKSFGTIFLDSIYIYIRIWHLSSSFWLISLHIIGSRFIQLIRTNSKTFLFMSEWYFIVYMYHNSFIHSSVDGYLGCFHVLAIVNNAAMNDGIHVSFSILVSPGYMPRSGIAGSYGGFIPSF